MTTLENGRPLTARLQKLRRAGHRYADLEIRCGSVRSSAWFNNLINRGPGRVSPPSDEKTFRGLAELLGVTSRDVRTMIAEEWYGVCESEQSERVRALGARIDQLSAPDACQIEQLVNRLLPPSASEAPVLDDKPELAPETREALRAYRDNPPPAETEQGQARIRDAGRQLPAAGELGRSVISYGPNLVGAAEQIHIHDPGCTDPKRKPVYVGHTGVTWPDITSLRDIVFAEYPPEDFGYEEADWRNFAGEVRVFPCVGELPDEPSQAEVANT